MIQNRRLPWHVGLVLAISVLFAIACANISYGDESPVRENPPPTPSPTPTQEVDTPGLTPTATRPPEVRDQISSATPTPTPDRSYRNLTIVTLLPRDAIPAILDPKFLDAEEAWDQYLPDESVLGISINGEHKAYSIPFLSSREIVNDEVGGVAIAATW